MNLSTTIIIGLMGASLFGGAVTPLIASRLAQPVFRFFAGRSYRFMALLVFAATVMLLGSVMIYAQFWQGSEISSATLFIITRAALFITGACFVLYSVAALWYARRIRQGTWKVFWVQALRAFGREL
jgi:hypothetical protein